MNRFKLSSWQRQRLRRQLGEATDVRLYRRTLAVLEFAGGRPAAEIARMLGVTRQSVYHWVDAYAAAHDPAVLADVDRAGCPRLLDEEEEDVLEAILAAAPQDFGLPHTGWTAPLLRETLEQHTGEEVSARTIRRALERLGYVWKRPRYVLEPAPERAKKTPDPAANPGAAATECRTGAGRGRPAPLPALAGRLLTKDVAAGWVLELVHRYPTAALLAAATTADLAQIPYLPERHVEPLLAQARTSIASLGGAAIEELVREQVRQLRDACARQKRLENLLVSAYQALPATNHLVTIPGIGDVTAAVLTAFIVDIQRFASPSKLVAYFGVLPLEVSSGVDRDGQARGPRRHVMSRRGNDLVRRYLWMAALSAIRFNPAVRALYTRVVAKHPTRKAVAVGHAMRKLLHLAWAVWTTDRPFDPAHYPWATPAHVEGSDQGRSHHKRQQDQPEEVQAASPKPDVPARTEVAAAHPDTVAETEPVGEGTRLDFAHLKQQLPLARVLDQLGVLPRLRGSGPQRRGPCPLHRGDARGRTFSVHLDEHVFHCFDPNCSQQGDVIDLWAAAHGLSLRAAALDLVRTFGLEPAPVSGTEKRNG